MKTGLIRTKLLMGFGCVFFIILLQGVIDYWRTTRVELILKEAHKSSLQEHMSAQDMLEAVSALRFVLMDSSTDKKTSRAEISKGLAEFRGALERAIAATQSGQAVSLRLMSEQRDDEERQEMKRLDSLRLVLDRFEAEWRSKEGVIDRQEGMALRRFLEEMILPDLVQYHDLSDAELSRDAENAMEIISSARWFLLLTTGAALLAALVAGLLVSRMITAPLGKMTATAEAISRGNWALRMPHDRSDELGVLSDAFNQMLDSLASATVTRDQLEGVVAERTRELDRFFTLSLDLLCIANFSGKFLRVNRAFEENFGHSVEEFISRPFLDFVHPEDRALTVAEMERCLVPGTQTLEFENRYRHRDGTWRWLSWKAIPVPEEQVIYAAARDVTDLKLSAQALRKSEESLRESEAYNRSIVQSSEDCLKVLSLEGQILSMSEPGKRALGIRDFEQIRNTCWASFWSGEDAEKAQEALREACEGHTSRFQGFCPTLDGVPKWWDVIVSPILDTGGKPIRLLAVSRDISRQRVIEEELRNLNATLLERVKERSSELVANEQRFRLMIEKVQDYAIFLLDPEGRIITWNAGAERLKGYTIEEILGHHFSCFYTCEDVEDGLPGRILGEATRNGNVKAEGWRVRKNGSRFWAEVNVTAIRDEAGQLQGFAKVTRDLTERRKAETSLKEALELQRELTRQARAGENSKSQFLATMSHEIRTPMNGIIGYADLLARAEELLPEHREYAQTLYQSGRALLRILDDILDFSSIEAGTLRVEKVPFSIETLLGEVKLLLTPAAEQKGLSLLAKIPDNLPQMVVGDPGRLRQILLNLTGNAIKFTETGSVTISVEFFAENPHWTFSVKDTGPGIPEERRNAIFAPFTQADASTSRRYGGTGLGLAISKRLSDLLGGTLNLRSKVGEGSEFVLQLPLTVFSGETMKETVPDEATFDGQFAARHPLDILVVEDDRINLKLIRSLLCKLGYDPTMAINGREAVEAYREKRPACILMDLQMPEMDGIEATEAIRALEKENKNGTVFIVALTANTVAADRDRCFEAGMSAYLNKPIRRNLLCEVLAQASEATVRQK